MRLVQLVHDIYGPDALFEAWEEFRCSDGKLEGDPLFDFTPHSPFLEQFTSWLTHTWTAAKLSAKPEGLTVPDNVPTQLFLVRHPDLDPLLAGYLRACIATPFSFFEVLQCQVERRFVCNDLVRGTQDVVVDSAAATLLRPRQIVYARIVEADGVPVIDAAGPWALPEHMKPAILALRDVILEGPSDGVRAGRARQRLLARELDLRTFYWGFIEGALKDDSLLPQVKYTNSLHRLVERVLMKVGPHGTPAETSAENEQLLANPEIRQQIVSIFTYVCEDWVNEELPILGGKTALEAVATPEGRLKVQALMDEMEADFSLLPLPLDPEVFRRVRQRLGLYPIKALH